MNKRKISLKLFIMIIVFLISIILSYKYLFGCAIKLPVLSSYKDSKVLTKEIVSIEKKSLDREGISLVVNNNSEYYISYGSMILEYSLFDNWYYMMPKIDKAKIGRAKVINPGESKEISFNWNDIYGRLSNDKYRFIIEVNLIDENDYVLEQYRDSYISYEFTI